jgi:aminoacyl tRNA synthase complex-interacting multifunctional protein 1
MLLNLTRQSIQPRFRHITYRNMSSISEFVAAAVNAQPSLAGSSDKDKAAISKLDGEVEGYAKDLKVGKPTGELWLIPLQALNDKLTPLTYLRANAPSSADVALYCHLHPSVVSEDSRLW